MRWLSVWALGPAHLVHEVVVSIVLSNYMAGCIQGIKLIQTETGVTLVSPHGREWSAEIRDSMHTVMKTSVNKELKREQFLEKVNDALEMVASAWKSHLNIWRLFLLAQATTSPRWSKRRKSLSERFAALGASILFTQRRLVADVKYLEPRNPFQKRSTAEVNPVTAGVDALLGGTNIEAISAHIEACQSAITSAYHSTKIAMEAALNIAERFARIAWFAGMFLPMLIHLINLKMGQCRKARSI